MSSQRVSLVLLLLLSACLVHGAEAQTGRLFPALAVLGARPIEEQGETTLWPHRDLDHGLLRGGRTARVSARGHRQSRRGFTMLLKIQPNV